jgi:hypothetical protein
MKHPFKMPKGLFLSGPRDVCAELSRQIDDKVLDCFCLSFEQPLDKVVNELFFGGERDYWANPFDRDQVLPILKTQSGAVTIGSFKLTLHHFLTSRYGLDALGQFALYVLAEEGDYFEHFVFEDAGTDLLSDVAAVAAYLKPENCLSVHLCTEDPKQLAARVPGVRTLPLRYDGLAAPSELFTRFVELLDRHYAIPEPQTAT